MESRKLSKEEHKRIMGHEQVSDTNQNHVSISLFDFDQDPNTISEVLKLSPSSIGLKGENIQLVHPTIVLRKDMIIATGNIN